MKTHILALLAAVVITEWLLISGWMSGDWQYFFWAGIVVIAWWLASYRNNPPWPAPKDYHIRMGIFGVFFAITIWVALMTGMWPAVLVALTILLVFGVELLWKRS